MQKGARDRKLETGFTSSSQAPSPGIRPAPPTLRAGTMAKPGFTPEFHQGQNSEGARHASEKDDVKWNDANEQQNVVVSAIEAGKERNSQRVRKVL